MGVTYKFKQEIVDFIVQKKKDDPAISCRRLVERVRDQFGVEVSKSSVNAVLQEFQLSSPVGRRAVYAPPKNFSIPQDRKESLLKNVAPFLTPEPVLVEKSLQEAAPLPSIAEKQPGLEQKKETVLTDDLPQETTSAQAILENHCIEPTQSLLEDHRPEEPVISLPGPELREEPLSSVEDSPQQDAPDKSQGMHLMPDLLAKPDTHSPELRIELGTASTEAQSFGAPLWGTDRGMCYEGMGLWLFVYLLAHVQQSPYLGQVVAEKLGLAEDKTLWQRLESLLLAKMFLADPSESGALLQEAVLSPVFQVSAQEGADWSARLFAHRRDAGLLIAARCALSSASVVVRAIRLVSSVGQHLYIDPDYQGCAEQYGAIEKRVAPLFSAIERCVDMFVTGARPVVLARLPWGISEERARAFLAALEGRGTWTRVDVLGHDDDLLASFDLRAGLQREFMLGARLSEEEYAGLDSDTIAPSRIYVDPFSQEAFSCFDGNLSLAGTGESLRTIVVTPKEKRRFVIITNSLKAPEEIVAYYLMSTKSCVLHNEGQKEAREDIFMGTSAINLSENDIVAPHQENSDDVVMDIRQKMSALIAQYVSFLNEESLSALCRVPGFFKTKPGMVLVRLSPPPSFSLFQQLEQSVFLINRLGPCDYDGNTVHFSVEKT